MRLNIVRIVAIVFSCVGTTGPPSSGEPNIQCSTFFYLLNPRMSNGWRYCDVEIPHTRCGVLQKLGAADARFHPPVDTILC